MSARGSLRQRLHPYCRLSHSTTQSLGNATSTTLTYDTVEQDNWAGRDTNNQSRLYANRGQGGLYRAWVWAVFASNATGNRELWFIKNGVTGTTYGIVGLTAVNGAATRLHTTWDFELSPGDYVEARGWQNSTGSLNVSATEFELEYLGMPGA